MRLCGFRLTIAGVAGDKRKTNKRSNEKEKQYTAVAMPSQKFSLHFLETLIHFRNPYLRVMAVILCVYDPVEWSIK